LDQCATGCKWYNVREVNLKGSVTLKIKIHDMNVLLLGLSIFSVIIIFVRQFVLYDVHEFLPWGSEFGELMFNLCIGFLTTYWFYYLTVYLREMSYKKRVYKYVNKYVQSIIIEHNLLTTKVEDVKNKTLSLMDLEFCSPEDYKNVLMFIYPNQKCGVLNGAFQEMNWGELFKLIRDQIDRNLKDIFIFTPYLDLEDIETLTNLYQCDFLEHVRNISLNEFDDLMFLGQQMHDMKILVEILKNKFQ
jgi:hypothetical protein